MLSTPHRSLNSTRTRSTCSVVSRFPRQHAAARERRRCTPYAGCLPAVDSARLSLDVRRCTPYAVCTLAGDGTPLDVLDILAGTLATEPSSSSRLFSPSSSGPGPGSNFAVAALIASYVAHQTTPC